MKNAALNYLLVSLTVFGINFGLGHSFLNGSTSLIFGYGISFILGIFSLLIGIKQIKKNHGRRKINILVIVGGGLITAAYTFFLILTIVYYLSNLPINP